VGRISVPVQLSIVSTWWSWGILIWDLFRVQKLRGLGHTARMFVTIWRHRTFSGVGVRLKVGDTYWEDWRGRVWGGTLPSPVGGLRA